MNVLITGSAGFIGFHLARRLLAEGHAVLGYDAMADPLASGLERARNAILLAEERYSFIEASLEDAQTLAGAVARHRPQLVFHLAAQAGVRLSLEQPQAYLGPNLVGSFNLLEALRAHPPRHLLVASSSSIYGGNPASPLRETDRTDFPVSFYAATKKAVEAMSHAYAHAHAIPTTCLRFFTVYGPWGRPDMALPRFVEAIAAGRQITVHGQGRMRRDFTYVDDLVEGMVRLVEVIPQTGKPVQSAQATDSLSPVAPWRSVNIGGGRPLALADFIAVIERELKTPARIRTVPVPIGEMEETTADPALLQALTGYVPTTGIEDGVARFVAWFRRQRPDL